MKPGDETTIRFPRAKPYTRLFWNFLIDLVCIRFRIRRFLPLITNFYVTKKCNLRCRFCYPPGDEPELEPSAAVTLLEKIRPYNPVLNFTGGEPLLYNGLPMLLRKAKELEFYPVILSTNALLIDRIMTELHLVDHLVISLDSLSHRVSDSLSGIEGAGKEILKNIKRCVPLAPVKRFHLSVHGVIAPETIDSIEDIVSFCESMNITLSLSPEHGRFYPNPGLPGNEKYMALVDRLSRLKTLGKPVACSYGYLKKIRDFSPHKCFPFVSPRVEPDGAVYFPCQRIKQRRVYLQDYGSLYELMREEAQYTVDPDCSRRCFLACYLEVERYIRNPFSILKEIPVKRWLFGKKSITRQVGTSREELNN
jgi:MoaA/NifB/PqqE/SkfB family radical SAM enzyme